VARIHSSLNYFDPNGEESFTLSRGHKTIEVKYDTLRTYAMVGKESVTGEIVKLEVCHLPYGLSTTVEAYRRFISRLNGVVA
jgi:hypothetical protein